MKDIMWRVAEAMDQMEGPEAMATHMKYLANYSNEQMSSEMGLPPEDCARLAYAGLRMVKNQVFGAK